MSYDFEIDGFEGSFEGEEYNDFASFEGEEFNAPALQGERGRIDAETASMLMDMYADMAAGADSEEEADAFLPLLGALAPLAMKAMPMVMGAARKVLPGVARGVMAAGKKMLSSGGPRALRALPNIARGVARDSLGRVANSQRVSGNQIMRSAARHTLPYLQDPRRRQAAARRCRQRAVQARRMLAPPAWARQGVAQDGGWGGSGNGAGYDTGMGPEAGGYGAGMGPEAGGFGGDFGGGQPAYAGGEFDGGDYGDYAGGAGGDGELF